jgi:iron complex outermembrane receptor protein
MKKTLLLSIATAALIANETFTLEEQTVTATNLEQNEKDYAGAVEIYTDEDIKNAKVRDIYEFLNQETSVITLQASGSPFTQKISMRGFNIDNGYKNIAVVINGRRMNNIDNVPQLLSSIPVDSIKKLEIIKGSGSVEYGDGANAGVLSITTKDFDGAELRTYAGNFDTYYGSFGAGYANDKFSFSAFGDYFETDGQRALTTIGETNSGISKNGNFNISYYPTDALELRTNYTVSRIDTHYAGALTLSEYKIDPSQATTVGWDTHQTFASDLWSFGLSYELTPHWSLNADLFFEDKESVFVNYSSKADYDYDSGELSFKYENNALRLAFGSAFFDGERNGFSNLTTKENLAGFIKTEYTYEKSKMTAGARVERIKYTNTKAGTTIHQDETQEAYELGYNYSLDTNQALFASFSHAYQTPSIDSFFDLFSGNFTGFIDTMKSDTYTLGYKYITAENNFKFNLFYIDLDNEIYYDTTLGFGTNTNLDKTSKLGFELSDRYLITETLSLNTNYRFVRAKIEEDDNTAYNNKELPGVSKHTFSLSLAYAPTKASKLIASHTYRSSAYALEDFSNTDTQKQEAYHTTDLSASYDLNENIEFFAKIQNLFDIDNGLWLKSDEIFPSNFQRSYYAGLNAKF